MQSLLPPKAELDYLESIIERGRQTFIEVGGALIDIRDRWGHFKGETGFDTFDEYCRERWGFTDERARLLMQGARIYAELTPTMVGVPLPSNERQIRELARLPDPETRREVWRHVTEQHGENITAAKLREAVIEATRPPPTVADVMNLVPPDPVEPENERLLRRLTEAMAQTMRHAPAYVAQVDLPPASLQRDLDIASQFLEWLASFIGAMNEQIGDRRFIRRVD